MELLFDLLLWMVALAALVPMAVVIAECASALRTRLPTSPPPVSRDPRISCAVLIPAHNEEAGIAKTIEHLRNQLEAGDRLLVVADNCTDATAAIARRHGATVIERHDPERRGKGYALDFGLRALASDPPQVVMVVDADCEMKPGSLATLVTETERLDRPVQALYILNVPRGGGVRQQLSAFAFLFKNVVRPLGLDRLGFPCLLTGSGMAFPWSVLRSAALASGNLVEDMQLGIDLAVAGRPPKLCPQALVTSELPSGRKAGTTQRTRWEHGHLQTMLTQGPRLSHAAGELRRFDLLGLALELNVPPLSLLLLLWAIDFVVLGLATRFGGSFWPALIVGLAGVTLCMMIVAAWFKFGRRMLPLRSLLAAPFYILWKLPIYLNFLLHRQQTWIRTERERGAF
jgi:cellulose synthase/poly-beta-1,6-N-acetylglucosamine synthase-like glycosyltransferase